MLIKPQPHICRQLETQSCGQQLFLACSWGPLVGFFVYQNIWAPADTFIEGSLQFFKWKAKSLPSSQELCPSFIFLAYGQQKVSASDRVRESYIWLNYSKLPAKGRVCRGTAESHSWAQGTSAQDLSAVPHFTGTLCSTPEDKLFWEKSIPWCPSGLGAFLYMTAWELSGFSALPWHQSPIYIASITLGVTQWEGPLHAAPQDDTRDHVRTMEPCRKCSSFAQFTSHLWKCVPPVAVWSE